MPLLPLVDRASVQKVLQPLTAWRRLARRSDVSSMHDGPVCRTPVHLLELCARERKKSYVWESEEHNVWV